MLPSARTTHVIADFPKGATNQADIKTNAAAIAAPKQITLCDTKGYQGATHIPDTCSCGGQMLSIADSSEMSMIKAAYQAIMVAGRIAAHRRNAFNLMPNNDYLDRNMRCVPWLQSNTLYLPRIRGKARKGLSPNSCRRSPTFRALDRAGLSGSLSRRRCGRSQK